MTIGCKNIFVILFVVSIPIIVYYLLSTANISSHWIIDLCAFSTITVKNKNIISITVIAETLEKQNSSRKSFSLVAVVI